MGEQKRKGERERDFFNKRARQEHTRKECNGTACSAAWGSTDEAMRALLFGDKWAIRESSASTRGVLARRGDDERARR